MPPDAVEVLATRIFDVGYWSYTTVLAKASRLFEPAVGDAESSELRWVPFGEVADLPLHPGVAAEWPELRASLTALDEELAAAISRE